MQPPKQGTVHTKATTIGVDLAKSVFHVHGVDAAGAVVIKKKLRRSEVRGFFEEIAPCLIGMEACATSHFWARELAALGNEVRLMAPAHVKAYLKRGKNDAADAEAICEAVTRPTMRFVPIKRAERQRVLVLHRTRDLLVRQRTMLINAMRGHLAEFGIITGQGAKRIADLIEHIRSAADPSLPDVARSTLIVLADQPDSLAAQIHTLERRLQIWHLDDEASQRLATIPGVGNHHRDGVGRQRHRPFRLQVRPRAGSVPWLCPTSEFFGRKRSSRAHLEDGRWLPAAIAGRRRHIGDPPRQRRCTHIERLDQRTSSATTGTRSHRRGGEQDSAHRLGGPGARRD